MSKERKDVLVAWAYPLLLVPNWAFLKVFMTIVEKKNISAEDYFIPFFSPLPTMNLFQNFQ